MFGFPAGPLLSPILFSLTLTSSSSMSFAYSSHLSMGTSFSGPSYAAPTIPVSIAPLVPNPCGEIGCFILNFDDIPPLAIGDEPINNVQPMPLFNPYHQFDFSDGFTVVPPPTVPYLSSSKPLLLEFIPRIRINESDPKETPNTLGQGISAGIGSGDFGRTGCFSFSVKNASFGCDSTGPGCDFSFSGFRFENTSSSHALEVAYQRQIIKACPSMRNCSLTPIHLNSSTFVDLDFFRINLTVAGQPRIWWMDDLSLDWFNNSCAAGKCRVQAHVHRRETK